MSDSLEFLEGDALEMALIAIKTTTKQIDALADGLIDEVQRKKKSPNA